MKIEEFKRIVKWDDSYKGKGLRIAVCELGLGYDTDKLYDANINAIEYADHEKDYVNERTNNHTNLVGWIIRALLPEAEIFLLNSRDPRSLEWIKNNNIHLVNLSISNIPVSYFSISDKTFLVSSAGNDGPDGETMLGANSKYWFQVGALEAHGETIEFADYSSWKYDLVDGASFSGIETPYGIFNGTSCSGPSYLCTLGQYMGKYNAFFGEYPLPMTTMDFIDRHSSNVFIFDPDSDLKIGYGLLILPEKYHFIQLTFGFPEGQSTSHNTVIKRRDGIITTQKIEEPAIIMGGRTYLPLRATSKLIGGFIGWNDDKRLVEYYLQQGDH